MFTSDPEYDEPFDSEQSLFSALDVLNTHEERSTPRTTGIMIPVETSPSIESDEQAVSEEEFQPNQADQGAQRITRRPKARSRCVPHSTVEKRYRESINVNIERLHAVLPPKTLPTDIEDCIKPARPVTKSLLVEAAAKYIPKLFTQYKLQQEQNADLEYRIRELQKLANCEGCPILERLNTTNIRLDQGCNDRTSNECHQILQAGSGVNRKIRS